MSDLTFVYVTYIETTPEKLWEALTSGAYTQQYWGGRKITSTWEPGAPVQHIKPDGTSDWYGDVLHADPPNLLAYTFIDAESQEPETKVTMQLEPYGSTIRLTVTHENLDEATYKGISFGWPAILSSLKSLLERGEPLVYPWKG